MKTMRKWLPEMAGVCSVVLFCYGSMSIVTNINPWLITRWGLMSFCLCCGFLVAWMVHIANEISEFHIFPVVTIARLTTGRILLHEGMTRMLAQAAGAAIAVGLLVLIQRMLAVIDPQLWLIVPPGKRYTLPPALLITAIVQALLVFLFVTGVLEMVVTVKSQREAGLTMVGQLILIALLHRGTRRVESDVIYDLLTVQEKENIAWPLPILILSALGGAGAAVLLRRRKVK